MKVEGRTREGKDHPTQPLPLCAVLYLPGHLCQGKDAHPPRALHRSGRVFCTPGGSSGLHSSVGLLVAGHTVWAAPGQQAQVPDEL